MQSSENFNITSTAACLSSALASLPESTDNHLVKTEQCIKVQTEQNPEEQLAVQRVTKQIKKRQRREKVLLKPSDLLKPYQHIIPQLIEKPQKSKRKATNIPKFIIKIFYKSLPTFPTPQHNQRLRQFSKQLESSITRFHLVELFGLNNESKERDIENRINREVLRRLLIRNFDNILSNTHIQHKRIYMLFSKKMLLRLNQPRLVGNIEI